YSSSSAAGWAARPRPSGPAPLRGSVGLGARGAVLVLLVLGEQPVDPPAGLAEDLARRRDLARRSRVRDLPRRAHELERDVLEIEEPVVEPGGRLLPGGLRREPLDLGAAPLGELEDALAVSLVRAGETLVLELLERGVDASGARPPEAIGALGELADDLVAVHRLLGEEGEDRGADVAPPRPSAGAERPRCSAAEAERPAPAAMVTSG